MTQFQTRLITLALSLLIPFFISTNLQAQEYELKLIVNEQNIRPGDTEQFTDFRDLVALEAGDEFVFVGSFGVAGGIYSYTDDTVNRIADDTTLIPLAGGETFGEFNNPNIVHIGDRNIVFKEFVNGIYGFINGSLTKIVDRNDTVPGLGGNFMEFFDKTRIISLGDGDIAFRGDRSGIPEYGIYGVIDNIIIKIVDETDPVPTGIGNFSLFSPKQTSIGDKNIVFTHFGDDAGIYASIDSIITKILNNNDTLPAGLDSEFTSIEPISLGDGDIAFADPDGGVYAIINGVITIIANGDTLVPMGDGDFSEFYDLVHMGDKNVAFRATGGEDNAGIYAYINNTLIKIADRNTNVPMGQGTFVVFDNDSLASNKSGDLVFRTVVGIYGYIDGELVKIADLNSDGLSGNGNFEDFDDVIFLSKNDIAFVGRDSVNEGIYIATKVEPATASITIIKETNPEGLTGFEFTGTNFPEECGLNGTFTLDDNGSITCDLASGSYTIQEINSLGTTLTDINCLGATSLSETANSVTIDLMIDEDVVCTFTNVDAFADLSISKTGNPDSLLVGEQLVYSFTISNAGPDTAPGVTITDVLPGSVSFVSATDGCVNTDGTVVCDLGNIQNGGIAAASIIVTANDAGELFNTATVSSDAITDNNTENNSSTTSTQVDGPTVDLTVNPQIPNITVNSGDPVSISVDITNTSDPQIASSAQTRQTAEGVIFNLTVPTGFTLQSLTTNNGVCNVQVSNCNLGDIAPGQTVTVLINAVAPQGEGVFNVSFSVFVNSTGQTFNGSATVNVEASSGSGGGGGTTGDGGGGGCAIAGENTTKGSLAGLLLFALIPAAVFVRRHYKSFFNESLPY